MGNYYRCCWLNCFNSWRCLLLVQSWKAKKAKEAVETARDKFFQNIQYEVFASFKKDCDSAIGFLQRASRSTELKGKSEMYVADGLESFITKLNEAISASNGDLRKRLESHYQELMKRKTDLVWDNRTLILEVLEEVRRLSRTIKDAQTNNKLEVG